MARGTMHNTVTITTALRDYVTVFKNKSGRKDKRSCRYYINQEIPAPLIPDDLIQSGYVLAHLPRIAGNCWIPGLKISVRRNNGV